MTNPMIRLKSASGPDVMVAVKRIEAIVDIGGKSAEVITYGAKVSLLVDHSLDEIEALIATVTAKDN